VRNALFLIILFMVPAGSCLGGTLYQGEQTLWQDTVWSGEVVIDGILTVAPEVRLEIRPGTTVRFTFYDSNGDGLGEHELFIQGRLLAEGRKDSPVRFTSAENDPRPGAWGAINMMASEEDSLFRHCVVEYAYRGFHAHFGRAVVEDSLFRRNLRAFQFQDSTVRVSRCRIEDNFNGLQFRDATVSLNDNRILRGQWAIRCVYSDLTLTDNRIEGNRMNGVSLRDSTLTARDNLVTGNRKGVYLQRSQGTLSGNRIERNSEHGTFFEDSQVVLKGNKISGNGRAGVRWLNSGGEISGNDLASNGEYALVNDGRDDLRLGSNWWGDRTEEYIDQKIRDGKDRPGKGLVLRTGVLAESPFSEPPALRLIPN